MEGFSPGYYCPFDPANVYIFDLRLMPSVKNDICGIKCTITRKSIKKPYREYYTSTRWRRFILQRVVSKTYLTSESELDTFGNHEL